MTSHRQTLVAILAFATLLASPIAGGCEAAQVWMCGTSGCPMEAPSVAMACHGGSDIIESTLSGCESERAMSIDCCGSPVDADPATIDLSSSAGQEFMPLALSREALSAADSGRPPDDGLLVVATRLHQVGRFTLLSSFLL